MKGNKKKIFFEKSLLKRKKYHFFVKQIDVKKR